MNNAQEFHDIIKQSMEAPPELYMKSYSGLTQRTGARHGPREMRNQSANVFYSSYSMKMTPFGKHP